MTQDRARGGDSESAPHSSAFDDRMRPSYGLGSMKLYGTIAVRVQAADVLRSPKFLDKVRRAFGGKPDLRTGKMRSSIEATALVEASRDALRKLDATNAISLVIDDTVLFHDREGKPDDLGDLFLAFADNESVFGQGFDELRLAVEHREGGLHIVVEIQARPVHAPRAPAVRVIVSGRIEALTPRPSEDAESFKKRAEPIASDARALELHRVQFETFVARLRDAIASAMPTATVEVETAEARIVRPDAKHQQPEQPQQPTSANYDPYVAYYPNPLGFAGEMLMWSAMFSMMMPPHYAVVDHHNHAQGFADDPGIQSGPTTTAAAEPEGGSWWGGDDETAGAADDTGGDVGGDLGGGDLGGGDFGGGDFGGDW